METLPDSLHLSITQEKDGPSGQGLIYVPATSFVSVFFFFQIAAQDRETYNKYRLTPP